MVGARVARAVVPALLSSLIGGAAGMLSGPAAALPGSPSDHDLERARQAESEAATAVVRAEQRLAAAYERFDELVLATARAVEAHNGAQYALEQARVAESEAAVEATRDEVAAGEARSQLGRVAATAYRTGGQLALLAAVIDANRPDQFVDGTAVLQTVARSQGTIADLAAEAATQARVAAERARRARQNREEAAQAAEVASEQAAAVVVEFETQVAALERERELALAELAQARGTTLALEEQRQATLAMAAAADEERAAASTSSGADDSAESAGPAPEVPASESAGPAATPDPSPSPASKSPSTTTRPSSPSAQPSPNTPPTTSAPSKPPAKNPPPPPSGAQLAVDYARAQLGKPYEWGAAGPDAFDCSGLTMRAWQQAGVYLPHWSVAQARIVTRVSYADLRPGDLIFWSDNGQASGTYHVGLYIGSGKMIHAPRPGKVVEIQSVFYWRPPSFYGRV